MRQSRTNNRQENTVEHRTETATAEELESAGQGQLLERPTLRRQEVTTAEALDGLTRATIPPAGMNVEVVQRRDIAKPQTAEINPLAMLATALEKGHDVEKLGKLMDLAERYEANQARKAFAAAMSQFQADCPPIVENKIAYVNTKDGGSYSYSYADLDAIMATIRPTLKATGLSVSFDTMISDDGTQITSLCHVMHAAGHKETTRFVCPVDQALRMNDSQKMGSANSYANRYNVLNAFALTAGEDNDGAGTDRARGAPPAAKASDIDEFFPVGKHKGERWDSVPLDYLEWVVANMEKRPDVVAKAKEQIQLRGQSQEAEPAAVEGELSMAECARTIANAKRHDELTKFWPLVPERFRVSLAKYYETRVAELSGKTATKADDDVPF
jgi:ERF superfamily